MACACRNKKTTATRTTTTKAATTASTTMRATSNISIDDLKAALNKSTAAAVTDSGILTDKDAINLPQCYMCAKKHLSRAQIYFEEYHTGYPTRIKLLTHSMQVAEAEISKAYKACYKALAHMDMAAGELLGNEADKITAEQLSIANAIRGERLKLQDDPMYIPDFESLMIRIQALQYSE